MRKTIIAGWVTAVSSLAVMFIGHLGDHDLSWTANHISTFSAQGPNGAWITASILLFAASLFFVSILIMKHQVLGTNYLVYIIPLLMGAAISGLVMLASSKETAMSMNALQHAGFSAIRQQSFHDAGLLFFYYSSLLFIILSGAFCLIFRKRTVEKILGIIIACLPPASYYLMTTSWPIIIGWEGPASGLKQRASLLCIWLEIVLLLVLSSKRNAPDSS
jgi:hypothetical protein